MLRIVAAAARRGRRAPSISARGSSASARPASSSGSITFSSAVSAGSSWNDWNTKPTMRPRSAARRSSSSAKRSCAVEPHAAARSACRGRRGARAAWTCPSPRRRRSASASPRRDLEIDVAQNDERRESSPLFTVLPMPRRRSERHCCCLLRAVLRRARAGAAAAEQSILVFGDSLSAAYGLARARGWVALLGRTPQAGTSRL